jgi:hypothetical protein
LAIRKIRTFRIFARRKQTRRYFVPSDCVIPEKVNK